MNIDNYKILISNLPVRQQCFTTKRTTWKKAENQIEWLKRLNDKLFSDRQILTISRQDIFEAKHTREVIIKTIYWGYPRGMRGNHFVNTLKQIDLIEGTFLNLRQTVQLTTQDFIELTKIFKKVSGLGLSTYSKLLHFFNLKINENPCQILDQRLIDVLASKTYVEFQELSNIRYDNADKKYLDYLQLVKLTANKLETKGENIEQFLFTYGNNLKIENTNK